MKLEHINYLLEVAKQGSLNKAAKALYIAQPNLSSAIKDIEQELNLQIFSRTNRGITVTEAGQELINSLSVIAEQLDYLLSGYKMDHFSTLQFSLFHNQLFSPTELFCKFKEVYQLPDLTCEIKSTTLLALIDLLSNAATSCLGIAAIPTAELPSYRQIISSKNLNCSELFTTHGCLIVGHKHPFFHKNSVTLEDVATCELAYYAMSEFIQSSKLMQLNTKSRPFLVHSKETLLELIAHSTICGLGNAYLESAFYLQSPLLHYIPVYNEKSDIVFCKVTNQNFSSNTFYDFFIEFLKDNYHKNYIY